MTQTNEILATGRRKTAVARVRMKPGTGLIRVNGELVEKYFENEQDRIAVLSPLQATKTVGKFDITARVDGGGKSGQAGAVLLGLARALKKADAALHRPLREAGLLTRDSRMKERKKFGLRGARRGCQFSKR